MKQIVLILLMALALGLSLAACAEQRTKVYLWPPAADVNDP
jgi:hypothetical protein